MHPDASTVYSVEQREDNRIANLVDDVVLLRINPPKGKVAGMVVSTGTLVRMADRPGPIHRVNIVRDLGPNWAEYGARNVSIIVDAEGDIHYHWAS